MNSDSFFQNKECKYFPCHKVDDGTYGEFNCMMCFCPLYYADCGGNFCYTAGGIKDCTNCTLPHLECAKILQTIEKLNKDKQ